jgi:hypothetical protein
LPPPWRGPAANPILNLPLLSTLIGPEKVPTMVFEPSIRDQFFAP